MAHADRVAPTTCGSSCSSTRPTASAAPRTGVAHYTYHADRPPRHERHSCVVSLRRRADRRARRRVRLLHAGLRQALGPDGHAPRLDAARCAAAVRRRARAALDEFMAEGAECCSSSAGSGAGPTSGTSLIALIERMQDDVAPRGGLPALRLLRRRRGPAHASSPSRSGPTARRSTATSPSRTCRSSRAGCATRSPRRPRSRSTRSLRRSPSRARRL